MLLITINYQAGFGLSFRALAEAVQVQQGTQEFLGQKRTQARLTVVSLEGGDLGICHCQFNRFSLTQSLDIAHILC